VKHLLAGDNRDVLAQFAWSRVLVALDYDGTLAPIVLDPLKAHMRARTRELLASVAARYPTVVVSGRGVADVARFLTGVPVWDVAGNHGLEPWDSPTLERYFRRVRAWCTRLREDLSGFPGVTIEDKRFSVAVHYRRSRRKKEARAAIRRALARLEGARVVGGKCVVNALPDGAPHKGIAVDRLRKRFECDTVIYAGDDETDEDVFAVAEEARMLAVRIGRSLRSGAAYYLRDQREMDRLLAALVDLRTDRNDMREP
jgi:trehalose 6-phosphate phosphatase